ncbi:hypothetical protein PYW07_001094 [Mythimna separata]|uniref:Uncharacterized protein n=1 Tax=Mythimna separata TaxID=271217 RepID=A0AAD7YUJ0_MYTSE|nr:hypothetical protein PYW07_001094 [Mythimna separata]
MDPCSCGESCECYRTTVLMIPHQNELMVKALRYALLEHASSTMMEIFDRLIESRTGNIILAMLLEEGGTTMTEVNHILRYSISYRITSRALLPRVDRVKLQHHTKAILTLPVTIPAKQKRSGNTSARLAEPGSSAACASASAGCRKPTCAYKST